MRRSPGSSTSSKSESSKTLRPPRFLGSEHYPDGWHYYWKSQNVDSLNDKVLERLMNHAETAPSEHSTIDVWYQGGAMARVGAAETAFGDRSSPILLGIEANWEDQRDDEANISWIRDCVADMRRFSSGGMYLTQLPRLL
jgi:hypothetical protein